MPKNKDIEKVWSRKELMNCLSSMKEFAEAERRKIRTPKSGNKMHDTIRRECQRSTKAKLNPTCIYPNSRSSSRLYLEMRKFIVYQEWDNLARILITMSKLNVMMKRAFYRARMLLFLHHPKSSDDLVKWTLRVENMYFSTKGKYCE